MPKKEHTCLIHTWSDWVVHKATIYSKEVGLHYAVIIHEKVCKKCFKLKAKLKKK